MGETKTEGQLLNERLMYNYNNAWEKSSEDDKKAAFDFCEEYKKVLNAAKTEREFAALAESMAVAKGFIKIEDALAAGKKLAAGDKVYQLNREKSVLLAVIGKRPIEKGVNVTGAHIDSPRIDLKQNPLYEDTDMALFKTHYYGGIKKYQWVTVPMAIHGVIVKNDGSKVKVTIGEDDNDPVFTITDLLPHLAQDQMQKKATEVVTGESLNLLVGSIPFNDEKAKDKVKLNIMNLLNRKYGIIEQDFQSAEIEIVPAHKAKDIGIDRSMIGGYGQDDRVCAFPALKAITELGIPERTAVCILSDKEEIGSTGNTGAESTMLEDFIAFVCSLASPYYTDIVLRRCLRASKMLSADVNAAVDPNFEGVNDKKNSTFLGKGVMIQKYTGSRGKYGASDANAEFVGEVRRILSNAGIIWQTGELGKVDQGGGGTIALYAANIGMEVIDCGVPVLSMHSPFEISSKIDIYMSFKAYKAFYAAV